MKVQIADRVFAGQAEAITDRVRIADFLVLRLKRHPFMMRMMLLSEGLPPWSKRAALERLAAKKALLAIRPLEEESRL